MRESRWRGNRFARTCGWLFGGRPSLFVLLVFTGSQEETQSVFGFFWGGRRGALKKDARHHFSWHGLAFWLFGSVHLFCGGCKTKLLFVFATVPRVGKKGFRLSEVAGRSFCQTKPAQAAECFWFPCKTLLIKREFSVNENRGPTSPASESSHQIGGMIHQVSSNHGHKPEGTHGFYSTT